MSALQSLIRWFIPDESRFYDYVVSVAEASERCAQAFYEMAKADTAAQRLELLGPITEAEREGDKALRTIAQALDATFVTPIDREDLYHLASSLEVVSDFISSTANHLTVHHMEQLPAGTVELAKILLEATTRCTEACRGLRQGDSALIREACRDIERLEHDADVTFRDHLARLFTDETNAIQLIKDKEFLEGLEDAVDRCADVATVLEAVLIKNG
jgi:predicted phosphate transport protein (TIGR00153 family)